MQWRGCAVQVTVQAALSCHLFLTHPRTSTAGAGSVQGRGGGAEPLPPYSPHEREGGPLPAGQHLPRAGALREGTKGVEKGGGRQTDREGYREPPELAEGGSKGRSGAGGNHRKTGKAPALKQRGAAWPQGLKPATKSLTQGAALERLSKRVKRQEAAKQQTAMGSNWPEPQGNPQLTGNKTPASRQRSKSGLLHSSGRVHNTAPRPSRPVRHTLLPVPRKNVKPTRAPSFRACCLSFAWGEAQCAAWVWASEHW